MILGHYRWVTRYSVRGCPYQAWEPSVPRIADEYMASIVYLYPSVTDAENGSGLGGSGFLIALPTEKIAGGSFRYIVTNRHVIEHGATVVRINTRNGGFDIFDYHERNWLLDESGADLAVLPFAPNDKLHKYKAITASSLITKEEIEQFNVGPGDDVFFPGRFVKHEGTQSNLPTLRFGHIAQMPTEPLRYGLEQQESFLVEAHSIAGYSGSPVFVMVLPHFLRPDRPGVAIDRTWILGVDWAHTFDWRPICDAQGNPVQGLKVQANTGLMAVVPAWRVRDLLNHQGLKASRDMAENEHLKTKGERFVEPDVAAKVVPPASDKNPKHREDFTSLVNEAARKRPQDGET